MKHTMHVIKMTSVNLNKTITYHDLTLGASVDSGGGVDLDSSGATCGHSLGNRSATEGIGHRFHHCNLCE